ncbi:MAG: thioredoxin domain-containing protein [Planctomycetes bacterium]|nr:thioredoxin domain-containing protein [Planctomycetota bacterium]
MGRASFVFFGLILLTQVSADAGDSKAKEKPKHTNRLAKETSPYLLMHAHNPTDWHPWGPEAFEKAKKENKLIFLSIGYSSCYWCHVMERESFNNEKVAKILNDHFICIKVDREERPDIDQVYMTALNMLRQSGGWPLSMFLTSDGRPIFGGTYWPPEDKRFGDETMKGFKSILNVVADLWKENPKDVEKQADKLAAVTATALENAGRGVALVELDRKLLAGIVDDLKDEFDPEYGGFGNPNKKFQGPKFPVPSRLEFLLQQAERTKDNSFTDMACLTLDRMALGGIYDQVGGGFHRYSTERTWNVPHFEKMLYDNAQLAEVYARAYRMTKKPHYRRILEETLAYVEREMMSPEGAFYSSQDAETHHEEGRSYVWTPEELAAALPDKSDLSFIRKVYDADGKPNFEGKYHILHLAKTPFELAKEMNLSTDDFHAKLNPLRQKLFEAREKRDKPFLNKIALTSWSGQMIAGFAETGVALGEKKYLDVASKAADFVLAMQRTKDGRLLRTYGAPPGQAPKAAVHGYLEDYAFLTHGLLALHDATKDNKWLDAARQLTDVMIEFHGDRKSGGYYFTAHDHEKLFARSKDQYDGAQPSGNSVAARNLTRLWIKTGEDKYRAEAERVFKSFAGQLKSAGSGLTALATALDLYIEGIGARKKS